MQPIRAPNPRSVSFATDAVSLVSRGIPSNQPLLRAGCQWLLDERQPFVRGAPHFIARGGEQELHLFYGPRGWQISPDVESSVAYAMAPDVPAAHPNTVRKGEWQLPTEKDGTWAAHPNFDVHVEGPNTEDKPFSIDDIGTDFFVRIKTTRLVWFVDPNTNEVVHSGAKNAGFPARPGKRYCPLCCQCFSANNFVSQHIKYQHTPAVPSKPTVLADGDGGAALWWTADGCVPGAQPSAFKVQYSADGGSTWETVIANTGSAEARARIAALTIGATYQFRVATIALAATGPYSDASAPFTAMAGAPSATTPMAPRCELAPIAPRCELLALPAETTEQTNTTLPPAQSLQADQSDVVARMNAGDHQWHMGMHAGDHQWQSLQEVVARMNASLAELTLPNATPVASTCELVAEPAEPAKPCRAVPADVAVPRANSLKRKQALQDFLGGEIDRVLTESPADLIQHAQLIGGQIELKLSIPVPKELSSSSLASSMADLAAGLTLDEAHEQSLQARSGSFPHKRHAAMADPLPARCSSLPIKKRVHVAAMTACASVAASPPLTPPISPKPTRLVSSPFEGCGEYDLVVELD